MQVPTNGAQRASGHHSNRVAVFMILALILGSVGLAAHPIPTAAAAQVKVVIVVGPVEGNTPKYISTAQGYAALARSYGAAVTEVYSPNATWTQVQAAARGANIFIYLGHGNGYPSPYGPFSSLRKNGLGLNSSAGHGNSNVKYWGQTYMRTGLHLANNSVVLLNHLCYASGDSEPGQPNPSRAVASQRADGYGTGFLRTGAKAVFADGNGSLSSIITNLFTTDMTVVQMFESDWSYSGAHDFAFTSKHTPGATVWLDPHDPGRYYHSVNGKLTLTAAQVRAG
ncbi:MAG: hypothetical protein ACXWNI_07490 [Candidatus Limnocylindrales bacterium]